MHSYKFSLHICWKFKLLNIPWNTENATVAAEYHNSKVLNYS